MSKNNNNKSKDNKENQKLWILLISIIILIVLVSGLIIVYINNKDKEDEKTLAYTELIKELSYGNIEKIEMTVGSRRRKNFNCTKHRKFYGISTNKSSRRK